MSITQTLNSDKNLSKDRAGVPLVFPAYRLSSSDFSAGYVRAGSKEVYESCGHVKFAIRCSAFGHKPDKKGEKAPQTVRLVRHTCSRLACRVCVDPTSQRDARRVADRLEGLAGEYRASWLSTGKKKHFTFSPNDSQDIEKYKLDGGRLLRKEVSRLLKRYMKNFYGGVLVVHLERKKHLDGSDCNRKGCTLKHDWIPGAHVHFVGYGFMLNAVVEDRVWKGWHIPVTYQIHREGWNYKRIKESYADGVREKRNIFGTVSYLLTHSALFLGVYSDGWGREREKQIGQAYHYVGAMANCKGGFHILDTRWIIEKCEHCGSDMHKFEAHTKLGTGCIRYLGDGTKIVIPAVESFNIQEDLGRVRLREIDIEWYLLRRAGWRIVDGKRRPYYEGISKNGQSTLILGYEESEY